MAGRLFIGTSSWSEKGWIGPFYPPGTRPGDFLAYYATQFDTVEIDSSYYHAPARRVVEGWRDKTPAGFVLSAKFPRVIVHGGQGATPDPARLLVWEHVGDAALRFVEDLQLLGDKLGPLLLQFPYFNRQAFGERAPFLERLEAFLEHLPKGARYAVELRNKSWIDDPLCRSLERHRTALALSELAYLPHPSEVHARLRLPAVGFAYARLIGDRQATEALTESFDRIVLDQSPSLALWQVLLGQLRTEFQETYVYANNHYAGHGPATARALRAAQGT